jgi:succinate dehydrogenase / fumarate reductase flavoprotein subunit
LGSNSILELITMGNFVGERVSGLLGEDLGKVPGEAGEMTFSQFSRFLGTTGGERAGDIREAMQAVMTEKVSVFRNEKGLTETKDALNELKERSEKASLSSNSLTMNQELIQRWELENLLAIAMVITQSALRRKESRGAHYREDFPERKDEFNYHTLASITKSGEVHFEKRAIDMSLFEEKGEHYEHFGMIERKY